MFENPTIAQCYERCVALVFDEHRKFATPSGDAYPNSAKGLAKIQKVCAENNWSYAHYLLFCCRNWKSYWNWAQKNGKQVEKVPYLTRLYGELPWKKYVGYLREHHGSTPRDVLNTHALNELYPERLDEAKIAEDLQAVFALQRRDSIEDWSQAALKEWMFRSPVFLVTFSHWPTTRSLLLTDPALAHTLTDESRLLIVEVDKLYEQMLSAPHRFVQAWTAGWARATADS